MSFLFSLPKYSFMPLLQDWCEIKEIAMLDTSCCVRKQRDQFLELLSCLTHRGDEVYSVFYPIWIWIRRIKVKTFCLDESSLALASFYHKSKVTSVKCVVHKSLYH